MSPAPYFMGNVPHDIKVTREMCGMTQREFAVKLGITPQYLNDIEHGRRRLPDERIVACEVTAIRSHLIAARVAEYETKIAELRRSSNLDSVKP